MRKLLLALCSAAFLVAGAAHAVPIIYTATLTGPDENPPNASPGTGVVTVEYDPDTHLLDVETSFAGLLGETTIAHIHCCVAPPGNIIPATQVPSFEGFPQGVTSGNFSISLDLTQDASFNPAFLTNAGGTAAAAEMALAAGLDAGMAYFNIHTSEFGGGEIRGFLQVQQVPEPASLLLLCIGIGVLFITGGRQGLR